MFHWSSVVLPGVSVAFTDTGAGNLALHVGDHPADVLQRRALMDAAAGVAPFGFQFMNQIHGNEVVLVEAAGEAPTADGMVSTRVPLAVMVADCIPLILVGQSDLGGTLMGAVHAGRPGLAAGIIPAAVARMRASGARGIRAWIGPSICGACYEVPGGLRTEVADLVPAAWSTTSWGTPGLDLPAGARSQLEADGVTVEYSGPCTLESADLFSYRGDRHAGRFAGLVWTHD
ncbi:polyphenol oxidase family protein [Pseudarthrobacter sp. N5]|uniref:polyphenol oxidase family protein n=1 Tax=Pseudarthrobacter sp. N5 TaxID=3418416 RepID=UPI003CF91684